MQYKLVVQKIAGFTAAASLLLTGVASAQVAPSNVVNVTSNPNTSAVSAGTGVTLGTVTIGAPTSGNASLTSIPLTLNAANGGVASNLSNCQLYNANGVAVSGAGSVAAGSNTINFSNPLNLTTTSGNTTLTVRCDVAAGTASGSTFQFTAGQPTFSPGLQVSVAASPTAQVGTNLAPLALITLDATRSGQNIRLNSLPLTITATGGAGTGNLSNCGVRNVASLATPLNTGVNAVGSFTSGPSINFDAPLTVNAGSSVVLAVTCDVASSAPVGGSFQVSLNPGALSAFNTSNNAAVTPSTGFTSTGGVAPTSGTVVLSSAASNPGTPSTPGVPNTGFGGLDTSNMMVLLLSGLLAAMAAGYLALQRQR